MPTDPQIDPSETTVSTEETPPSPDTTQPSQEPTESVEELKEKLAAAETEAKRWKGRVEKASEKKISVSEEELDWKIANVNRINLVKDAYQKELDDLQAHGAKLSNELREKALKLAESTTGVTKVTVEAEDNSLPAPTIDRTGSHLPQLTEYDRALQVKPETKKEFREYVEGR